MRRVHGRAGILGLPPRRLAARLLLRELRRRGQGARGRVPAVQGGGGPRGDAGVLYEGLKRWAAAAAAASERAGERGKREKKRTRERAREEVRERGREEEVEIVFFPFPLFFLSLGYSLPCSLSRTTKKRERVSESERESERERERESLFLLASAFKKKR